MQGYFCCRIWKTCVGHGFVQQETRFYIGLVAFYILHIFGAGRWATAELSWCHIHEPGAIRNWRPSLATYEAGSRLREVQQCCANSFCASVLVKCCTVRLYLFKPPLIQGDQHQAPVLRVNMSSRKTDNFICSPTACKIKVKEVIQMQYKA